MEEVRVGGLDRWTGRPTYNTGAAAHCTKRLMSLAFSYLEFLPELFRHMFMVPGRCV